MKTKSENGNKSKGANNRYNAVYFFLRKYKKLCSSIFLLSALVALFESLTVACVFPFLKILLGNSQLVAQSRFLNFMDKVITAVPFGDKLIATGFLFLAIVIVKVIFKIVDQAVIAGTSARVLYDTRKEIMAKYSKAQYEYFLRNKQGTLMYYVSTAPIRLSTMLYLMSLLATELLKVVAIIILLLVVNFYATLTLAAMVLMFTALFSFLSRQVSSVIGRDKLKASTKQDSILSEFLTGIKHIRIYNVMNKWLGKFNEPSERFSKLYAKDLVWIAVPTETIEVIGIGLLFLAIVFLRITSPGAIGVYLPAMGAFSMAILKILPSLRTIGKTRMQIGGMLADAAAIYDLERIDFKRPKRGTRILSSFDSRIRFENVTFRHESRPEPVLKNLNLCFEKNRVTAIVGASGAGKTTIINLLLGLFDNYEGSITVDGVDLKEYALDSWLKKIGLVSQEPFIFHSTVAENISFGEERYSMREIEEAAKVSDAHDFITEMPEGYNTVVGERGMRLSGGQQQRIAIARAVIRKPEVLILDEATSALDSLSEKSIQNTINNIAGLYTLIIIAHRLSTVKKADRIFVLKEGTVIEDGSHEKLLANNGFYKDLYEHQAL